jgi:hypothetical protein
MDANIAAMADRRLHMIDGRLEVASTIVTQAEKEEIGRGSH